MSEVPASERAGVPAAHRSRGVVIADRGSGDLLEACQLVHEDLLADVLEVHVDLAAIALTFEAQDRALAEFRVPDARAEPHWKVFA